MQHGIATTTLPDLYAVPDSVHAVRDGDLVYVGGLTARQEQRAPERAPAEEISIWLD